jgi:ribosome-associated toxin RatA of RatAB toxin-antitoxin module
MRTIAITIILMALGCSGSFASDKTESKWELAKDKQGVKVYTRKVKGIDLKEFRGVMTIKTSLTSLVALVSDAEAAPDWLANCSKSKVLKRINPSETYVYSLSKAPWPVMDRDSIIHSLISQDPTTLVVTIKQTGKPDYIKAKNKIARVKRIQGFWQLTPQKNGKVEVVYQALSDPGGAIPAWLINASLVSQPYETLLKIPSVIKKAKYRKAKLEFIKEQEHALKEKDISR